MRLICGRKGARLLLTALIFLASPRSRSATKLTGQILFPEGYPDKYGTVLWIEKPGLSMTARDVKLLQHDMRFSPHITVLSVGSTLDLQNDDSTIHGVKSESGPLKKLRIVMTPKRRQYKFLVREAGVSEVLCDIHSQMNAYVVSVPTDVFAISDSTGAFELERVPEPPFTVKVWHEILPPQTLEIKTAKELNRLEKIQLSTWSASGV